MTSYRIWDPLVRIFHWLLVAGFGANVLIVEDDSKLHEWIGYAVLTLVVVRILWGIIGPEPARFSSFLPRRDALMEQLSDIATRRRRTHLGHTPLGALMIVNLLVTILAIGLTGHLMTTHTFWGVEWVEDLHEALVVWAGISIAAHIAAVLMESWRTGVNLPRAMITGRKQVPDDINLVK